jgi:hypothetical protein
LTVEPLKHPFLYARCKQNLPLRVSKGMLRPLFDVFTTGIF